MRDLSLPSFDVRAPWWGGDLQTLRNIIVRLWPDLDRWSETGIEVPLRDGLGDHLLGRLHGAVDFPKGPLVILVHGLTGCEDSLHVRATAQHLLTKGYPVLRINLRGAGPGRSRANRLYHAGASRDFTDLCHYLREHYLELVAVGLFWVGYSLGASTLLSSLIAYSEEIDYRAGVAVSAPLDLAAAAKRLGDWRNRYYQGYFVKRMIRETLAGPGYDEALRHSIAQSQTLIEFDHKMAPENGFADLDDYYRKSSVGYQLGAIRQPTLFLHGRDDPWIPAESITKWDWNDNAATHLELVSGGGHVGFHSRGHAVAWHDRAIVEFLKTV